MIRNPLPTVTGLALATGLSLLSELPSQGLHIGPPEPVPGPSTTPQRPVRPGGRIVRRPQVSIKSLGIKARIVDGVATTQLRQVFHNAGGRIAEGTWILPLPPGATADHFTMTMNGKQVSGEVIGAGQARSVYESIVRKQRDPGLLEYMGNGCLRARVFPIPAKSDMVVEVRFRQVLPEAGGMHQWSFPLRNAHVRGAPAKKLSLDVVIESKRAIKNVYSPLPNVHVRREGDHRARLSLEMDGGRMASRDLDVFYGISDQEFGLNLLTHREAGKPGYFVMMLAPKLAWDADKVLPKCVTFVLDTSGSMKGKKMEQARGALRFFVQSLRPGDFFNVVPFSTGADPFFLGPVPASKDNIEKALSLAKGLQARGGTNIENALSTALSAPMPEIANLMGITVFLTDGMPTVDTTDPDTLLSIIAKKNERKHRIFVFGVGHDVNTRLLDSIAKQSHGDRDYVREHESIEIKTGALFTKLSHPVMSKVSIDCAGIEGFDVFPRHTPDLFKGGRLLVTGRYKGKGHHSIRLRGTVEGEQKTFVFEGVFPEQTARHDFIPTLWAQRKVAVLLDAIRLNGAKPELVSEVRRLGGEHGIVTPYSSHLILEEADKVARLRGVRDRFGVDAQEGGRAGPGTPGAGNQAQARRLRDVAEELKRAGAITGSDEFYAGLKSEAEKADKAKKKGASDRRNGRGSTRAPAADAAPPADGKGAVDYSLALRKLQRSATVEGRRSMATRQIAGRRFFLVGTTWVDARFKKGMEKKVTKIKAFSDEYFALLKKHPELKKVFAFSSRIVVVIGSTAVEIVND